MMTPKELLDTILGYLGFVVQIEESQNEAGNPVLQIYTEESRRLIGRDGETLEALQFLLNRLLQAKDKDAPKVVVDCEMYRSMREDRIAQRVRELAERVRATGRSLQLEPMNSYERRIVHNAFKDDPDIATWSPSDSARIKQITLLKRQPKKEPAQPARLRDGEPARFGTRATGDIGNGARLSQAEPGRRQPAVQRADLPGLHPPEHQILIHRDADRAVAVRLGKLADHARQCDLGESEQRHRETIRSVHSSFHFTFTHGTLPFSSETISRDAICVTRVRGGGELSRSRVSISFSMSFNPARM